MFQIKPLVLNNEKNEKRNAFTRVKFPQGGIAKANLTGFTLIEALVYIVVLVIIMTVIISFLFWSISSSAKVKVMAETLSNAKRVLDVISYESREAKSVYLPTSLFDYEEGQLSLETLHYLSEGENETFVDFYLCGSRVCFKREFQDSVALTSENVEVSKLNFKLHETGDIILVTVSIETSYKNPNNKPEYDATVNLQSTFSLRSY